MLTPPRLKRYRFHIFTCIVATGLTGLLKKKFPYKLFKIYYVLHVLHMVYVYTAVSDVCCFTRVSTVYPILL